MKKALMGLFLGVFLIIPAHAHAASLESTYRDTLLELISVLQAKIELLEHELAKKQKSSVLGQSASRQVAVSSLRPSAFYDGPYEALYNANGYRISPIGGNTGIGVHQEIWNMFVSIIGNDMANMVSEYRVYSDRDADFDAFVDLIGADHTWVFGVNVYDLDLERQVERDALTDLLIHEYGHMVMYRYPDVAAEFKEKFWDDDDLEYLRRAEATSYSRRKAMTEAYYEDHERDFVSEYAATDPLEDVIESFVVFVREGWQAGDGKRAMKVNFFYAYPEFTEISERLGNTL